jgi:IPT/TIG domain
VGRLPSNRTAIEKSGLVQEGSPKKQSPAEARPSGQIQGQAQSPTAQTPGSQAGDKLGNSSKPNEPSALNTRGEAAKNTRGEVPNPIFGWVLAGGLLLLALIVGLIAQQWSKTPRPKDDDKALESLRIIYGFWLIVAALLIALLVLIVTLTAISPDSNKASDIVAIAGTVTGLITTLTAAFFGIQQAGAGRSQAMTALAQSTRADGAVVGKLEPSYGPHSGGTKISITGNGFTGASGVNFGATPGTDPSGRESRAVTAPAGNQGSDVPVKLVFPVETANKIFVVGTYHYD